MKTIHCSILIYMITSLTMAVENLVFQEFQSDLFATSDISSWTNKRTKICQFSFFSEFSQKSLFGVFGVSMPATSKTITSLPPHWSVSVRFDLLMYNLVENSKYVEIAITNSYKDQVRKSGPYQGDHFCGLSNYDLIILYSRNVTHSTDTLTVDFNSVMTEDESNEGFAIKNFQIYVDKCHFSCQTCNGPSEKQCLSCPPNSYPFISMCFCNSGYYAYQNQCLQNCPIGYIPSYQNIYPKCIENLCNILYCQTCDPVKRICTQCNNGKFILNGKCVDSCPNYAPNLIGSICNDYQSNMANGAYIVQNLYSDTFGESDVLGAGIVAYRFTGFDINSSSALVTRCGNKNLLGGAYLAGQNSDIQMLFNQLLPHWQIKIGFKLYIIDTWMNNQIQFFVDGISILIVQRFGNQGTVNICGRMDNDEIVQVQQDIPHSATQFKFSLITNLPPMLYQQAYGIRELYVLVDYCIVNCTRCDSTGCLGCISGYLLFEKQCVQSCPFGTFQTVNGTCESCDTSCKTCSFPSNKTKCTSCNPMKYLNVDGTCKDTCPDSYFKNNSLQICQQCNLTCNTCNQPGDEQSCLSCTGQYYLLQGRCVTQCQPNQYKNIQQDGNLCSQCHFSCGSCDGPNANNCLSCFPYMFFQSSTRTCNSDCDRTQFKEMNTMSCVNCDSSCDTCIGQMQNQCRSCTGSNYFNPISSTCTQDCSSGTFKSQQNNICLPCHPDCLTCLGPANTDCLSCGNNLFLQPVNGSCVQSCFPNQFQDILNYRCDQCNEACLQCSGQSIDQCLSCSGQLFFDENTHQCVDICPLKTFKNTSNNKCTKCDSTCLSCDDTTSNSCLSCESPRFWQLNIKKCTLSCDSNQYQKIQLQACFSCDQSCTTCIGSTSNDCLSCSGLSFLDETTSKCVTECPPQFFKNSQTNKCTQCHSSCSQCNGENSNNCLSCNIGLFFQPNLNTCVQSCNSNQYQNTSTQQCYSCHSSCLICDGLNENNCLSCSSPLFWMQDSKTCKLTCNLNEFKDTSLQACSLCDSSCTTCRGPTSMDCLSCSSQSFLDETTSKCVTECPPQFFENSQNNKCTQCDSSCQTCNGENNNNCLTCVTNFILQSSLNTCVSHCDSNQFKDNISETCQQCNIQCLTCNGADANNCLSCPSATYLDRQTNTCVQNCSSNFYNNPENSECSQCNSHCLTCDGPTGNNCLTCHSSLFLQSNTQTCGSSCNPNQYQDSNLNECVLCHSSCTTCSGSSDNNCLSCSQYLYLNPETNKCTSDCPSSYYNNTSNNKCEKCFSYCLTCFGQNDNNCLSCSSNLYLNTDTNKCNNECPQSYFKNNSNNQCSPCHSSCLSCSDENDNNCLSCSQNFYLNSDTNTCTNDCPLSFYQNTQNNKCEQCHSTCQSCSGTNDDNCLSCSQNLYLNANTNKCSIDCPQTYYKNTSNNQCSHCHSSCATCNGANDNNCLSCSSTLHLDSTSQKCVSSCPIHYFQNPLNNECQICDISCNNCDGPINNNCKDCQINQFYNESERTCVDICNQNQYGDIVELKCKQCHNTCNTCSGGQSNQCISCNLNTFLNAENSCVETCPQGQYNNVNLCSWCHNSCSSCTGPNSNNCLTCSNGLIYDQDLSTCLIQCTYSNQFKDVESNSCKLCHSSCATCFGKLDNNCLSCNQGMVLQPESKQCVTICRDHQFYDQQRKLCLPCNPSCITCSGDSDQTCLSCQTGYKLVNNSCVRETNNFKVSICEEGLHLLKDECVKECPYDNYIDNMTHIEQSICAKCHYKCESVCDGPSPNNCHIIKLQYQITIYFASATAFVFNTSIILSLYFDKKSVKIISFNSQQQAIGKIHKRSDEDLLQSRGTQQKQAIISNPFKRDRKLLHVLSYIHKGQIHPLPNIKNTPTVNKQENINKISISEEVMKVNTNKLSQLQCPQKQKRISKLILLGNEWISLFLIYDPVDSRVCRLSIMFFKYFSYLIVSELMLFVIIFSSFYYYELQCYENYFKAIIFSKNSSIYQKVQNKGEPTLYLLRYYLENNSIRLL